MYPHPFITWPEYKQPWHKYNIEKNRTFKFGLRVFLDESLDFHLILIQTEFNVLYKLVVWLHRQLSKYKIKEKLELGPQPWLHKNRLWFVFSSASVSTSLTLVGRSFFFSSPFIPFCHSHIISPLTQASFLKCEMSLWGAPLPFLLSPFLFPLPAAHSHHHNSYELESNWNCKWVKVPYSYKKCMKACRCLVLLPLPLKSRGWLRWLFSEDNETPDGLIKLQQPTEKNRNQSLRHPWCPLLACSTVPRSTMVSCVGDMSAVFYPNNLNISILRPGI